MYKRQVHNELDVMAVQFQELGLDQLCRVIVPGHPDGLAVLSLIHILSGVSRMAGFGEGTPQQDSRRGKMSEKRILVLR